jgi:two-component system response regulator YesN
LLEEDENTKIFNDNQNEDSVRQHFRSRVERLINKNYQYSDYNVKLVIKQVCENIKENYMNDITLAEMAEYSNLSTSYFSTLFKQYTGQSFVNYVNRTRIDRSKLLLMEADIRIYDVADMVGFSSLPYFNRVFKKVVGMSPNEYRKSLGIC